MKQPQKTSKMNEQQATNFCHQQPSLAVYLIIKSDREGKVASFTVSSSKGTFFFFFLMQYLCSHVANPFIGLVKCMA